MGLPIDFKKFMAETVYDYATEAGTALALVRGGVDKTTVSNLLEVFQSESDPSDATSLLITHIMRQMGRGEILRDVGNTLLRHLSEILNSFREDELRSAVFKYLTLSKWIFEARPRISATKFTDFIRGQIR
jgi:hypothetical protein